MIIVTLQILKTVLFYGGTQGLTFITDDSQNRIDLLHAVKPGRNGEVLQSASEWAAFDIEVNGNDLSDFYLGTRTSAVYFMSLGKFHIAFDDTPVAKDNIILARAKKGYDSHYHGREYLLPIKDVLVQKLLARAERAGRVVDVPEMSPLELATGVDGMSPFGQDSRNKAIFGDAVAEPHSCLLRRQGYKVGLVYCLMPNELTQNGVDRDHVTVRLVGLGGRDDPARVHADYPFNLGSFSTSVRRVGGFDLGAKDSYHCPWQSNFFVHG